MFYASSLYYPSQYANRLQVLQTAEALGKKLGADFMLGCNNVSTTGGMYKHALTNFYVRRSPILALKQLLFIRKHGFTLVYSREYTLIFLMLLYNKLLRLPIEFYLEVHEMHDSFRFRFVVRRCKNIFCITSILCDDVKKEFDLPVAPLVLPDGVDVELFSRKEDKIGLRKHFGLPEDAFIAAYVGSVGRYGWKGVDVFLDSFEKVVDENIWYVVVGVQKEDIDVLRNRYRKMRVRFFGWLDRNDVVRMMHLADILVLPNKKGNIISERYTSPLKLFEYMASGTPIIASNLSSIREVLDETSALFVPPNDPNALAEAISKTGEDLERATRRATAARAKASGYTWDARAHTITRALNLYTT